MKRKLKEEGSNNGHGDGVSWSRGKLLGKGGYGSVYLVNLKKPFPEHGDFPPIMVVKSAEVFDSSSLQKEKEAYNNLYGSPYILCCYGQETTFDHNGMMFYNLLLEYASGGTLGALIKQQQQQSGGSGGLPESQVKFYTRCILQGIYHIHTHGYVHCDLKPDNILLVPMENPGSVDDHFIPKIADFGLVKNVKMDDSFTGGTPQYMAPETLADRIQEFPCDIWALGCIVFEMFTGKKVWDSKSDATPQEPMEMIGDRIELPVIPSEISEDGRDFLKRCLVKKPEFRFTAEMLLYHPFVSGLKDAKSSESGEILNEECGSSFDDDNQFCDSNCSGDKRSKTQITGQNFLGVDILSRL